MLYLINKNILFDDIECSIANKDTNDKILLPAIASRLLSLFIENHGVVLTRENILIRVWDNYGYRSSSNTLTQYVSLLRKNFQLLGENSEIIITIPRMGLVIPEEIEITLNDNRSNENLMQPGIISTDIETDTSTVLNISFPTLEEVESVTTSQEQIIPPESASRPYSEKKHKLTVQNALFMIFNFLSLTILCIVVWLLFSGGQEQYRSAPIYSIGKLDDCPVYMFYQGSPKMTELKLSIIRKVAERYVPCIPGNIYFAQPEDSVTYGGEGRVFVSRCAFQKGSKSIYSGCKNVYHYE